MTMKHYRQTEQFINKESTVNIAQVKKKQNAINPFNLHWTILESIVKYKDTTIFKEQSHLSFPPIKANESTSSFTLNDFFYCSYKVQSENTSQNTLSVVKQSKSKYFTVYQIEHPNNFIQLKFNK